MFGAGQVLAVKGHRCERQLPFSVPGVQLYHALGDVPEEAGSRVVHAQRIEEHFAEHLVDGLVAQYLDQRRGDLAGEAVEPVGARLKGKHSLRHGRDMLPDGVAALLPQRLHTLLHGLHCGIVRRAAEIAVRKSAFHGQYILDHHGTVRRDRFECPCGRAHILFRFRPFGQIPADRLCHQILSPLVEHHHHGVEREFGHGRHTEHGPLRDRDPVLDVRPAETALIDQLSPLRHMESAAGQAAVGEALQQPVKILESGHDPPPL